MKICVLSAAIVNEQFDVYPNYFVFENENNLEVNASNGVLNVTSESGEGEKEIEILYSVDSSNTNTGILYATVLANNSKDISDGGSLIDNEGGTEPYYEVGCGLGFSNFSGDGWIELKNRNGSKKIEYYGGELDVSSLDDIYLRVSYEFGTNTAKSYYSTDGQNFTELGSEYAPNDNFFVSLEVETRNVSLEDGDVYFDNFVISADMNYDSTLTDDPYSDSDGIVDSDGDGVTDSEDPFPNEPLELELLGPSDFQPKDNVGWIEVTYAYMNGDTFMPGIWHPIDTNLAMWFPFDDSWPSYAVGISANAWPYYWSSEQQTTTNSAGAVGNWSHYKTSNPHIYTCKFNWTNGTYGFGFSYDGRIDLDNDGKQDGIQIRSGLTFPAEGSQIDFHQIINSLSENLSLFTLPSSFTENDFDGDGRNNDIDLDDDNDGIADTYDSTPLVYNVSKDSPSSLNGYVEIFFSDYYPSYGIWYGSGENSSINIFYDGGNEFRFQDSYTWNSESLTSTGYNGGGTFRINFKTKANDLFFKFNYVWQSDDDTPDDSGKGFFYDGQIDLDSNGIADGEQIANGLPFPADDSIIDLANIYDSAESNFIPIQVLNYGQNEYDLVVAERDAKLTLEEVAELRPGSTMLEVSGNQATLQLQMEESSDLQSWEDKGDPATMTIPADTDTKFYRFKMVE